MKFLLLFFIPKNEDGSFANLFDIVSTVEEYDDFYIKDILQRYLQRVPAVAYNFYCWRNVQSTQGMAAYLELLDKKFHIQHLLELNEEKKYEKFLKENIDEIVKQMITSKHFRIKRLE
jgi:hypothetical protein